MLRHLRAVAVQCGEARFGFPASRIGTHSLRAGGDGDVTGRCTRAMAESGDVHAMYPDSGQQMTRGVTDVTAANSDFFMIERGEVRRARVTWAFRII